MIYNSKMRLNRSIDQLCRGLRREHPDWKEIQKRFEQLPTFKNKRAYEIHQYAKDFSEIYLDISLEHIAGEKIGKSIKFLPKYEQKFPLENQNYKLYHSNCGRIIVETDKAVGWEYDQIVMVNNIPTVLEIKIRKWDTGKRRKRKQSDGTYTFEKDSCVKNSLRHEIYDKKLEPVRKVFGQEVGYIMIISKEQYQFVFDPSETIINQFLQNKGRIVPFYTNRVAFREQVLEKVQEWGYLLKEAPQ